MLDLEPATRALSDVVTRIRDDQLDAPTPCTEATLGDLLDHVDNLALAFAGAAAKTPREGAAPTPDAANLGPDWRTRIPAHLDALAAAWRDPRAWRGMTRAGGIDMPAEVAGVVALDEVILHGWDIAVAGGRPYDCDPALVEAALGFVRGAVERNPGGTPGLFGAPVDVPGGAPPLARLLGLSGRDPGWRAPGGDGR